MPVPGVQDGTKVQEVFTAQLKSKQGQIKWTLSGVALFLDIC